jgi:hypothetical protein
MTAINTNPLAYLESLLSNALQNASKTSNPSTSQTTISAPSSIGQQPDSTQLSPLAQLLSNLQQLQQSNPTEYAKVTQQIATNLQAAAQTATSDGNTSAASQLSKLATDFTTASTSGQLPNIADLAQAVGGGHGHHHHHGSHPILDLIPPNPGSTSPGPTSAPSTTSAPPAPSAASPSTISPTPAVSPFLVSLEASQASGANGNQNDSLNPATIIFNTLAAAGITSSNS